MAGPATTVALIRRSRPPSDAERATLPAALVSMPFAQPFRPSIQLGLLSAIARRRGFDVTTFHLGP